VTGGKCCLRRRQAELIAPDCEKSTASAMYMYELMIAGGPVAVKAKKHERVRDSTSYLATGARSLPGLPVSCVYTQQN
jgi:hypothetical protein